MAVLKQIGFGDYDLSLIDKMLKDRDNKYSYSLDIANGLVLSECKYSENIVKYEKLNEKCINSIKKFFSKNQ